MATIVFSAIGTLVGGPLGGAIGALIGRQVDAAIIGSPRQEGPRLKELATTSSSYGAALPRHFGRMRVAGSVIWATDLVEHTDTQGGGKNKPKVTTYSYTASFAVALSSRPILDVGRIWADGNLLRGAAGDLKAGGQMRIYNGYGDQAVDPLIAQLEGEALCPAFRGLAYVVFEDLELGDFFNRIPALTFEVIADDRNLTLSDLFNGVVDDVDAVLPLTGIEGYSCEGPLVDTLQTFEAVFPMDCDAGGETIVIARERLQPGVVPLPEAAASVDDADFGKGAGYARRRSPPATRPPSQLRYYDVDRDYQPGLQRAGGRAGSGQPTTIELPAAISAHNARALSIGALRRADWDRDRMAWRTTELDPDVMPGAVVSLPNISGQWKVSDWEWRERGIELSLSRIIPTGASALPTSPTDPGRSNNASDDPAAPTSLVAFELPWDGNGSGDSASVFAALSSPVSSWGGAALFVDHGDGALQSLGPGGRVRSIMGTCTSVLPAGNPLFVDRQSTLVVTLIDASMTLVDATGRQLWQGANRAIVGSEIIQFGKATPLGAGQWELGLLLRGRGGTESAVSGHMLGEDFVLLDARPVALDPARVGMGPAATILALGRGDDDLVSSAIGLRGITQRPLSPVHPVADWLPSGGLVLGWTRRARGAWFWLDGVDAPLHEQTEQYQVRFGTAAAPLASWTVFEPRLELTPADIAQLTALSPTGRFEVRQLGSYALSEPLILTSLPL